MPTVQLLHRYTRNLFGVTLLSTFRLCLEFGLLISSLVSQLALIITKSLRNLLEGNHSG